MKVQNLYDKVKSGELTKEGFLMEIHRDSRFSSIIVTTNSYDDVISILKNKSIISDNPHQSDSPIKNFDIIGSIKFLKESANQPLNEGMVQKLKGGKGDKLTPDDVNYYEFQKGWRHELEHTDDIDKAKEIALDHLAEDPIYYTRLDMVEFQAKKKNRADLPTEVKRGELAKDPHNQMEKVKKISTSRSGEQKEEKVEDHKKNVGNKKEKPKKVKVKTMKGGSGQMVKKELKESLESIKEAFEKTTTFKGPGRYRVSNTAGGGFSSDIFNIKDEQEYNDKTRGASKIEFDIVNTPVKPEDKKDNIKKPTGDSWYEGPAKYILKYTTRNEPDKVKSSIVTIDDLDKFKKDIASKINVKEVKKQEEFKGGEHAKIKTVKIVIPDTSKGQKKGDIFGFTEKRIQDHIAKFGEGSLEFVTDKSTPTKKQEEPKTIGTTDPGKYQIVDVKNQKAIVGVRDMQLAKAATAKLGPNYEVWTSLKVKSSGIPTANVAHDTEIANAIKKYKSTGEIYENADIKKLKNIISELFKKKLNEYLYNILPTGPNVKQEELRRLLHNYQWTSPENDYQKINKQQLLQKIMTLINDLGPVGAEIADQETPDWGDQGTDVVNEDHLHTDADKIAFILATPGYKGTREELEKLDSSTLDKAYKNAEKLIAQRKASGLDKTDDKSLRDQKFKEIGYRFR